MKKERAKKSVNSPVELDRNRHSLSHLMAAAVMELWPDTKRAIGPAIENGFYYDFEFKKPISDADLPKIESKMREILPSWDSFTKRLLTAAEAKKEYAGNPYKHELIDEFSEKGKKKVSFYVSGNFADLCKGGHVKSMQGVDPQSFKLDRVAGAYWRGDEKNKMLTRIYGLAFESKEKLDGYLKAREEAERRDHRKLGKELDLFSTNPLTGAGLILWHPKLAIVRDVIERFWKEEHYKRGYKLVYTPHIATMDMFVKSRHLTKYVNSMFPVMLHEYIEGESAPDYQTDEVLKPMNCPNHVQIYKTRPRSYRELPLRVGELGTVYRYERAGVLHGMTRVRGFTQDDSHIFCTPDQVLEEIKEVVRLTRYFYDLFGFKEFQAYISTRPEKYLGTLEMWEFSQNTLKKALEEEGIDYKIDPGEGVFYGPKIDSKVKDSLGREWQLGTVQFDFNQPANAETTKEDIEEFWKLKVIRHKFKTKEVAAAYLKKMGRGLDVRYVDQGGNEKQAVMVHRVVLGSLERFFGILIEHYAGAFPLWLAPVQIAILPITDRQNAYAREVGQKMQKAGIRAEVSEKQETLNAKIRDAQVQKVPYMAIVGDKEIANGSVSVRSRDRGDLGQMSAEAFLKQILSEIERKA